MDLGVIFELIWNIFKKKKIKNKNNQIHNR